MTDRIPTLRVEYASLRSLDADHAAYLVHGGLLVRSSPPELDVNRRLRLEVVAPGASFALPARSGRAIPGQGRLLSLEPGAEAEKRRLDGWVGSAPFLAARDQEAEAGEAPRVSLLPPPAPEPEIEASWDEATDPDASVPSTEPMGAAPLEPPAPPERPPIRRAGPGEAYQVVVARFDTVVALQPFAAALAEGRVQLPAPNSDLDPDGPWQLRLVLPGHNVHEMWAGARTEPDGVTVWVLTEGEAFRRAVGYLETPAARSRLESERERGDVPTPPEVLLVSQEASDTDEKMPLRRRLQRMGVEDKINMALSGNREERMALAQDGNKGIHHYLLKNAKITIDEITFMARLPSLNPDVLDKIADNPGYTQNPSVTKALVFNPRTPIRTALRLLDRLPRNDLNLLSRRTGMNKRLVMAAKKKLEGKAW